MRKCISIVAALAVILSMFTGITWAEGNEINAADVSLSASSFEYDGQEKCPEVTVSGLTLGEDYTVEYVNNVNPGTAEAVITGTGEYSGSVSVPYSITVPEFECTGSITKEKSYQIITFGSYPQTEIVYKKSFCGTYGRKWETSSDYVVDSELYTKLLNATFNSSGDTKINGVKYHRMKMKDATTYVTRDDDYLYYWTNSTSYHYFRYDPIKWRVLYKSGSDAFLLSDVALDRQHYNTKSTGVTWNTSSIRTWLNGTFLKRAFTSSEQTAIKSTTLKNADNSVYGTPGGASTTDKIYLLSEAQVCGSSAAKYGFATSSGVNDEAKQAKSSTYAKAMGVPTFPGGDESCLGCCYWWLRTPGRYNNEDKKSGYSDQAMAVTDGGGVDTSGWYVNESDCGVRPVLHLNLKYTDVYEYAGYSDVVLGTIDVNKISLEDNVVSMVSGKNEPEVTVENLDPETDYDVTYTNNDKPGIATVTVTGKGKCTGSISLNYAVVDAIDISSMTLEILDDDIRYGGEPCCPDVKVGKLVKGTDYSVAYENNDGVGIGKVTVTGIKESGYSGSITEEYIINKAHTPGEAVHENEVAATYTSKGSYNLVTRCTECGEKLSSKAVTVPMLELGTVTGVKAVLYEYDRVKVSWSKVKGATGYYVMYRKSSSSDWIVKKTTKLTYTTADLKDGYSYQFKVKAYAANSNGVIVNKGEESTVKTCRTLKEMKAPTVTRVSSSKAKASWSKLTGATGYQISVTAKSNGKTVKGYTTGTYKTLSPVTSGNKYSFKVRAYKTVNGSKVFGPWSDTKVYTHK